MAGISTLGCCNVSHLPLKNHHNSATLAHYACKNSPSFPTKSSNLLHKGVLTICQNSINKNNSIVPTSPQYPCKKGLNSQDNILCNFIPAPNSNPQVYRRSLRTKAACSDEALVRVLESEVEKEEAEAEDVPADFPFIIKDYYYRKRNVKLSRQYKGETIEVKVCKISDDDEYDNQCHFDVRIFKDVELYLEFSCSVEPEAEYIYINSLEIKNRGTCDDATYGYLDIGELDGELVDAIHEYLNVRGITLDAMKFMHGYMEKKEENYKGLLNKFKSFVEA